MYGGKPEQLIESTSRGRWSCLDAGELEGLLPVAAVAQGNDPSLAQREHTVSTIVPAPAVVGVGP